MPLLRMFPLNVVVFPGQQQTLQVFEPRYRQLVREVLDEDAPFGIALIESGPDVGGGAVPADIGCAVRIQQVQELPDGRYNLLCVGTQRFRILRRLDEDPYLSAEVEFLPDPDDAETDATLQAAAEVAERFGEHRHLSLALQDGWQRRFRFSPIPLRLADYVAARLDIPAKVKQEVLQAPGILARLEILRNVLRQENVALTQRLAAYRRYKLGGLGVRN